MRSVVDLIKDLTEDYVLNRIQCDYIDLGGITYRYNKPELLEGIDIDKQKLEHIKEFERKAYVDHNTIGGIMNIINEKEMELLSKYVFELKQRTNELKRSLHEDDNSELKNSIMATIDAYDTIAFTLDFSILVHLKKDDLEKKGFYEEEIDIKTKK